MTATAAPTLEAVYVAALAESLDYNAKRAAAERTRAQAKVAQYAQRIADGERIHNDIDAYVAEYGVASEAERQTTSLAMFLATGARDGADTATPAERIASTRRWYAQEVRRVVEAVAHGWSSVTDPSMRATAFVIEALRDCDRDAWDAAVNAAQDPDAAQYATALRGLKEKRRQSELARDRARKDERIAELTAEIARLDGLIEHAAANVDQYRWSAEQLATRAIGGRVAS